MANHYHFQTEGPFLAAQLRSGDPYELSNGHPIQCLPSGGWHAKSNLVGGLVMDSDPNVESAGVDAGYAFSDKDLRAPDLAVGNVPDKPGWIPDAPPLVVEYADTGQDEAELRQKIREFLAAGTRYVWVVRLTGPRRVEVHTPDNPRPTPFIPGEMLCAPEVLKNPVPVEALYDRDAAHEATFRNLLQRRGYEDLDAVLREGREEGWEKGREKGQEEGREEGRGQHAMNTARKMLADGMADELILKYTGLSQAELDQLT